jgi:hypothetical protein
MVHYASQSLVDSIGYHYYVFFNRLGLPSQKANACFPAHVPTRGISPRPRYAGLGVARV